MKRQELQYVEDRFKKAAVPSFRSGDTISVWVKIKEGEEKDGKPKYRLQAFEGICIRYRKGGLSSTFTVRKISANSIGVERIFYVHSPLIEKIEVRVRAKVSQSRIYYIRALKGKAARITSIHE